MFKALFLNRSFWTVGFEPETFRFVSAMLNVWQKFQSRRQNLTTSFWVKTWHIWAKFSIDWSRKIRRRRKKFWTRKYRRSRISSNSTSVRFSKARNFRFRRNRKCRRRSWCCRRIGKTWSVIRWRKPSSGWSGERFRDFSSRRSSTACWSPSPSRWPSSSARSRTKLSTSGTPSGQNNCWRLPVTP